MKSVLTKSALGFGLVILLTACSQLPQQIEVSAKPIQRPELTLPAVDELNLKEVNWVVINEDNLDSVIATLAQSGKPFAIYGLTGDGYSNLGLNFSDIRALVQQQQAIIAAYEGYYKESDTAIAEHNQTLND